MKQDFFSKWEQVIKNTKLDSREPVWEQAIRHIMSEGDMSGTMARELSQSWIQDIIMEKGADSIYEMFADLSHWMNNEVILADYLSLYFTDGNEIWLAYLMATSYELYWNGETWKNA